MIMATLSYKNLVAFYATEYMPFFLREKNSINNDCAFCIVLKNSRESREAFLDLLLIIRFSG